MTTEHETLKRLWHHFARQKMYAAASELFCYARDLPMQDHLVARLRHAATTASNDDSSEPRTEGRARHCARIDAMLKAATALEQAEREIKRLNIVLDEKIEQITDAEGHLKQTKEIAGVDKAIQSGALAANANLYATIKQLELEKEILEAVLKDRHGLIAYQAIPITEAQAENERLREALEKAEPLLEERRAELVYSYEDVVTGELDEKAQNLLLPIEIALGAARAALHRKEG